MADACRPQVPSRAAPMRSYVLLEHDKVLAERISDADEDIHFAADLARAVLTDLTVPGDRVLDPFVGYGTTLRVAEEMGRAAVGVELLPERCAIASRLAPAAQVIEGDARALGRLVKGPFDLILTSPPYRTMHDHPQDPLTAYTLDGADYRTYLEELRAIMRECLRLLAPGGHLVINIANIAAESGFTPLAWDVGTMAQQIGHVVQDVPVCWDRPFHDLSGDHLIVIRA